jgi:hypothetical protein
LNERRLVLRLHALPMALVVWLSATEFTERPMAWRHADFTR